MLTSIRIFPPTLPMLQCGRSFLLRHCATLIRQVYTRLASVQGRKGERGGKREREEREGRERGKREREEREGRERGKRERRSREGGEGESLRGEGATTDGGRRKELLSTERHTGYWYYGGAIILLPERKPMKEVHRSDRPPSRGVANSIL